MPATVGQSRGVVLHGRVWPGGDTTPFDDGVVLVDATGRIDRIGSRSEVGVPADVPTVGGASCWVGPGVVDAHVHLAFASPEQVAAGGVTAARDLGGPPALVSGWRSAATATTPPLHVGIAGPILTAPHGYPSQTWGRDGFATFVADQDEARAVVRALDGAVDVIKVAIEPTGGPVPSDATVRAIVAAAHDVGLAVTAHALTVASVRAAVAAGVDELAHTPIEPLPPDLVAALAAARVSVISTLQTFVDGGEGAAALANATALVAAGVPLRYGTDLGNVGTRPGVDARELDRLTDVGLGRMGALRAATVGAAAAPGVRGGDGTLTVGRLADAVVLDADPLHQPEQWLRPRAVLVAGRIVATSR